MDTVVAVSLADLHFIAVHYVVVRRALNGLGLYCPRVTFDSFMIRSSAIQHYTVLSILLCTV